MKLLHCHIDNFGKIHDLSVDFSDGMHVIHEQNGWGKSTLAAFIKVMFFGFDTKREAGSFEKERILYRPWQGGAYGGELEFEVGGHAYRISRTFGTSDKTDEFHLYDCVTNLETNDFSWNIGEELFDLDSASFKRSIFITQNDCRGKTTDAINAKLGNLVENTNDINNYESAQEYLKNLSNQLSPNRATGSLKKRRNRISEVEQELHSYDAAEQAIEELRQKQQIAAQDRERLMQKRESLAGQLREAGEESRRKELQKSYLVLCEEQHDKLSALLPYQDTFPMGMPDEALLSDQIAEARRLEEDRNTLLHMELSDEEREEFRKQQLMFREGVLEDEKIDEQLSSLREIQSIRHMLTRIEIKRADKENSRRLMKAPDVSDPPKFSVLTVLGILFLLGGIASAAIGILSIHTTPYGLAFALGGALAFFLGNLLLVIGIRRRASRVEEVGRIRMEWEEKLRAMDEEIAGLRQEEADKTAWIEQIIHSAEEFINHYTEPLAESEEILDLNQEEEDAPAPEPAEEPKRTLPAVDETECADRLRELKAQAHEYRRLCEKTRQYEALRAIVSKKQGALLTYGRSIGHTLGTDITAELTALATEAVKYRMAKENAEAAQARVRSFEAVNDTEELLRENPVSVSIEELNESIHRVDSEIEEAREGISQYARQLESLEEQLDLRDEKEQELKELLELSLHEQKLFDTVTATQEFLQRAREQITARYMEPISRAFRKYYDMLAGTEEGMEWQLDANIDLRMKEQGELRETKWFSAGTQDLVGICMRLAMVDAMYQGEKPFLILDDPFVNLDEGKTKRGMQLLAQVAQEYQILYFTCNSSRKP